MARKTVAELLAQNTASFPNNTTGQITPALLRGMFQDFLDSYAPAYAVFQRTTQTVLPTVGTSPIVVPWETLLGVQAPEFTATAPATGVITRTDAVASTSFTLQMSLIAPNNSVITFEIFINGAPSGFRASYTSSGSSDIFDLNIAGLHYSATANSTYEVRISTDAGTNAVTITSGIFFCNAIPVRTA